MKPDDIQKPLNNVSRPIEPTMGDTTDEFSQPKMTQEPPLTQSEPITPTVPPQEPTSTPPIQSVSPLDSPPPPPLANGEMQDTANLKDVVISEKPKKGFPFMIILVVLIVIVLGGVGYLTYQNYQLKNKTTTPTPKTATIPTPSPEPYVNFTTFKSHVLPIEIMIPSSWEATESANPKLANQKLITAKSSDLAYEGATISAGYQFMVGPVNDLTKKYNSFDEFSAEENKESKEDTVVLNNIKFLKEGTTAKTLIDKTPVTIALYTSPDHASDAVLIFNKILASFTIVTSAKEGVVEATPSAKPTP